MMIVYLSDPKNSTKGLLQLINTFGNVAGYKVNSNKSVALLYTKAGVFSSCCLALVSSSSFPCPAFRAIAKSVSFICRLTDIELPKLLPRQFFTDLERTTLNIIWRIKKHRIAKSSLYNKAISGGITIPDFKLYYRATVLKTAWYWHKYRHVDQWNQIEDPDINPHRYENLIFDKDAKTVKWKKESIFYKWCCHNWMATCRRLQIDPYLSPCTKLKSKWIKDLNINPVTLNLTEEKVGSTLERIGAGDHFLNITPIAQTLSAMINQWDYINLRNFCSAKDTITKTKRQPTVGVKIFTNPTTDRGLNSRIDKELKKHDIKTPDSPIEKWAIELNREFTAEEYQMA
ncbi:hypothetical protein STEG23_013273 [Scotinomys teguina]